MLKNIQITYDLGSKPFRRYAHVILSDDQFYHKFLQQLHILVSLAQAQGCLTCESGCVVSAVSVKGGVLSAMAPYPYFPEKQRALCVSTLQTLIHHIMRYLEAIEVK